MEQWLSPATIGDVEYAGYWNDEGAELAKEWNVAGGDFARMERYLDEVGLERDLEHCLADAHQIRGRALSGTGVDLAAGTLWAARHLLGAGDVERLYCVEFSQHRLLKLGPLVLDHYGVDAERIVLALGSFYELQLADESVDFVFLSQALHHADRPGDLLAEIARVLRPDGVAIVIGEHIVGPKLYAGQAARVAASHVLPAAVQRHLLGHEIAASSRLAPDPDPLIGDHYYGASDYRRMFAEAGFEHRRSRQPGSEFQSFVLWRAGVSGGAGSRPAVA